MTRVCMCWPQLLACVCVFYLTAVYMLPLFPHKWLSLHSNGNGAWRVSLTWLYIAVQVCVRVRESESHMTNVFLLSVVRSSTVTFQHSWHFSAYTHTHSHIQSLRSGLDAWQCSDSSVRLASLARTAHPSSLSPSCQVRRDMNGVVHTARYTL